ncbi:MAG: glycosyltransferase family 39 protein [Anaerolineales bacterium]|nr:glycosyltransferase family 39 protein [Anaerolineales bacterium]
MKTKTDPLSLLILVFGLSLGAYARNLPAITVGFPVTDGGLFYLMAQALQANGFALPAFVQYNGANIPFAYPPLGFYLAALVSSLFKIPLIEVFRWLPAALGVAFTIAFYFLAAAVLKSTFKATLAAVFFALLPRSIGWFVMGGGITRAAGQLFLVLTLFAAHQLFAAPQKKYLWMTILFGGCAVLSHPESALHAAALSFSLWVFFGRSKEGIKNALLAALGVLVIVAPFFIAVISRHGLAPYQNAAQTGLYNFTAWLGILTGSFADEKFITVISALGLLGLIVAAARREFLLPVWLILPAVIDPRGAASILIIAWAMLAALGFADVVVPGLYALQNKKLSEVPLNSALVKTALAAMIFYSFFSVVASDQVYLKISLTQSDRAAMKWIADNVPPQSRFAVVTGGDLAFSDALSEWFPALTQNISVATIQGFEWLNDKPFTKRMDEYNALQACARQDRACIERWAAQTRAAFAYVLIRKDTPLASSLSEAADYQLIHEEANALVFKYAP